MDDTPRNFTSPPLVVGFVSLGCPKNLVDSERMLANLAVAGYVVTGDLDAADVAIVNTCAFIADARKESGQVIAELIGRKLEGRLHMVIVAGCYPQRDKDEILEKWPDVDAVVGLSAREEIADILTRLSNRRSDLTLTHVGAPTPSLDDRARLRLTPRHYAYLRVSEGCDNRCAYCTIPLIRGPLVSKPPDLLVAEAEELLADGAAELILIGQDTTAYGRDLNGATDIAAILARLDRLVGLSWLRLLYTHPASFSDSLLAAYGELEHFLPYVDLPLQHIAQPVLDAMGRRTTRHTVDRLIAELRRRRPDVILRTSLIVGFPGETDAHFAELLDFVRTVRFDRLGAFTYSREPDTRAADLPNQVPTRVKNERLHALMTLQHDIAAENQQRLVGQTLEFVIDRGAAKADQPAVARFWGQAPEIDGITRVRARRPLQAGSHISATVTAAGPHDLEARVAAR
jgi:ribosomal protein S12 methylthiotransferase